VGFITSLDLAFHSRHLNFIRYVMFAGPGVFGLLVALVPSRRAAARHLVSATVALSCALALPAAYTIAQPDVRPMARFLDQNVKPGEIIIFYRSGDAPWYGRVVLLGVNHYSADPRRWRFMILESPPDPQAAAALSAAPGVWLVSGTGSIAGEDLYPGAHAEAAELIPYVGTMQHVTHAAPATQAAR
jgi:hypothetical protein